MNIGNLEGKNNWATWKFKILILLRSFPGGEDVVNGDLTCPTKPTSDAKQDEVTEFNSKYETFKTADTKAMLVLSSNMTEETLTKVMRFNNSRDIWLELHRLFDGSLEDKTFDLCMKFFTYKYDSKDDMSDHLSKLKNIWNNMNLVMGERDNINPLPEILLICKILETLPSEYFSFKASWRLISKLDRTVNNLTSQLCSQERALRANLEVEESCEEAL